MGEGARKAAAPIIIHHSSDYRDIPAAFAFIAVIQRVAWQCRESDTRVKEVSRRRTRILLRDRVLFSWSSCCMPFFPAMRFCPFAPDRRISNVDLFAVIELASWFILTID